MTIKELAQSIAKEVGIELSWEVQDRTLDSHNFSPETSAIEILYFIATSVGGCLRWEGENKYSIKKPEVKPGDFLRFNVGDNK